MTTRDNTDTVGSLLHWATDSFTEVGISTPRLDSLILLEDTLDMNRAHLLAHLDLIPSNSQRTKLIELVKKRQEHIPLAYLRGSIMFYGRSFYVTTDTLVPRPETEACIDLLKTCFSNKEDDIYVADVGTGSGCLGITAALEISNCSAALYEIDAKALEVARKNAQKFGLTAQYFHEDLLTNAKQRKYDAILANLPYIPDDYTINEDAQFEPPHALFAGSDGLDDYRLFWQQLESFRVKPSYIIIESLPQLQHKPLIELARNAGFRLAETQDFVQLFTLV